MAVLVMSLLLLMSSFPPPAMTTPTERLTPVAPPLGERRKMPALTVTLPDVPVKRKRFTSAVPAPFLVRGLGSGTRAGLSTMLYERLSIFTDAPAATLRVSGLLESSAAEIW